MAKYVYNECIYCGKSVLVEKTRFQILYTCDECMKKKQLWDDIHKMFLGGGKSE